MASMGNEGPKKWRIQFMDIHQPKKRRTIRVSGLTKRQAEDVFRHIENIISARLQRTKLEDADAAWLGSLTDKFHAKLVTVGLEEPRETEETEPEPASAMTLGTLLQEHVDRGRTKKNKLAAESTKKKWVGTQRFLTSVFGAEKEITVITLDDAHQFRVWLEKRRIKKTKAKPKGQPMEENAIRKHIANCKMFFAAAVRRGLITVNPFEPQVSATEGNRSRDYFLTLPDTRKILDAAPDSQWRLLIALWRLAGLRKMEVFNLTWQDVLWDQGKLRVRSTKTEHLEGCDVRYVPTRDVKPFLEAAFNEAAAGTQNVITRFSSTNNNLDKPLKKIIEAAGLVTWPKLFQNMRSSCETQWIKDGERADLVANWIGHSVKVQRKNYLQHTDEDVDNFNSQPGFQKPLTFDSDDVRNDQQRPETAQNQCHVSRAKTQDSNEFAGEASVKDYPEQDSNLQPAA